MRTSTKFWVFVQNCTKNNEEICMRIDWFLKMRNSGYQTGAFAVKLQFVTQIHLENLRLLFFFQIILLSTPTLSTYLIYWSAYNYMVLNYLGRQLRNTIISLCLVILVLFHLYFYEVSLDFCYALAKIYIHPEIHSKPEKKCLFNTFP